jgi:hypothetical protein
VFFRIAFLAPIAFFHTGFRPSMAGLMQGGFSAPIRLTGGYFNHARIMVNDNVMPRPPVVHAGVAKTALAMFELISLEFVRLYFNPVQVQNPLDHPLSVVRHSDPL